MLVGLLLLVGGTVGLLGVYGWLRAKEAGVSRLPVMREVGDFVCMNQWGEVFSSKELEGRVWLVDLIFTRCPGPCLKLTRNFAEIQRQLSKSDDVKLISFTADPDFDTPEVLRAYGEREGASRGRWDFLTAERGYINRLVMDEFLLALSEKPMEEREAEDDLFLHSTKWVLVDRRGRLRGIYEGTERSSVSQAMRDIRHLLRERSE
ncbi:MAG: SCO family protein [Limisphaerales bacterium]